MIPSSAPRLCSSPTRGSRLVTDSALAYPALLIRRFETAASPEAARKMAAYMRHRFAFYGIQSRERRILQRRAETDLPTPVGAELLEVASLLWAEERRECQYAACDHLIRHGRLLDTDSLAAIRGLVTEKPWWDSVDALATRVVGPIVAAGGPAAGAVMDAWLASPDMWLARAAILHQLHYGEATDADWLFSACLRWAPSPEFFLRKAIGWSLRQYARTDADAVATFVAAHADELSPLSKREALKHIA